MTGEKKRKNEGRETDRSKYSDSRSPREKARNNKQQSVSKSRKAIQEVIYSVRNKVKVFKKEHLGARSNFNFSACSKCLEEQILQKWNISSEKVKDHKEFSKLTLRKEVDEDVMSSDEYIDLISIGKRANVFESLVADTKPRMEKCLQDQVYKSCLSLNEMAEDEVMIAVTEYDSNIIQYKLDIDAKLNETEENYEDYEKLTNPFSEFVKDGEKHTAIMNKTCNNLLELCKLVEDWLHEDSQYPDKLVDEFQCNKKIQENLQDSLVRLQAEKLRNIDVIDKLKKSEARAEECYTESKKNKQKIKARQAELEYKKAILTEKINKLREVRVELTDAEIESGQKSQRESSIFQDRLRKMDWDIARMESDKKKTERHLKKLEKDLKPVNERTYEHKVDAVTLRNQQEDTEKETKRIDSEMSSIKKRIKNINANNEMLMKIREMKLQPDIYRKCVKDKRKKEVSLYDGSQDLTDACKFAAPYIGKDWQKVYFNLPFDPPREPHKRHNDVDVLDYIAGRNDIPWNDQALKCLEKWRTFHRKGNVQELVQTLRSVKKKEIANELENRFLTATT